MIRAILIATLLLLQPALADTLKIVVPSDNDSYNINARILSRYIVKYLPDHPTPVIQSVPGAASLVAANYLYNVAPRDGSVIGTFYKEIPMAGILKGQNISFDPENFLWLGSNVDGRRDAVILWSNTQEPQLIGSENYTAINPAMVIKLLGQRDMRIVVGYPDTGSTRMALERGEVQGVVYSLAGIKAQKPGWLLPGSGIFPVLQFGNGKTRHPEYSGVQTLSEVVQSSINSQTLSVVELSFTMLRPFVAPPGVPERRIMELRTAFALAVNDPEYREEAARARIDVSLIDWREAEAIVHSMATASPETIGEIKKLVKE